MNRLEIINPKQWDEVILIKAIAIYFPNGLDDFFDAVYKDMIGFKL